MEAYQRLEIEWAEWNNLDPKGMVACSSGCAALLLALEALRLPPGSEVVTGDFNMIAVPRAIAAAGHLPVFVDCDERLLIDPLLVPKADEKATAVVVVHIYGRQLNFDKARNLGAGPGWCWRDGLKVIEDLAEAHGVRPQRETDAACWSFYSNKIVAGAEGGAVWFRDPEHAALARSLRSLGFTAAHDFWHAPRGWNHRMSNAHAELILVSLGNFTWNNDRRREIEALYDARCPKKWRMPARDSVWVFDHKLPSKAGDGMIDRVVTACKAAGIEARHSFKPMHLQEEFRKCRLVSRWDAACGATRASEASERVMYLPVIPSVTDQAFVRRAFDAIESVVK